MREDEVLVEVNRLLVVLLGIGEVALDEVGLGAVVVNIGVIAVLLEGLLELGLGLLRLTKLQADASALDVALDHLGVELDALVEVLGGLGVVSEKCADGTSHVVSESLVLAEVSKLQSLLEGLSSLLVALAGLLLQSLETELQLAQAGFRRQFNGVFETGGTGLGTEALEVVAHKDGAGQSRCSGSHHLLGLLLGKGLQQPLDGLCGRLALEVVNDA